MSKIDLKQQMKTFYQPPRQPVMVDIPPMNFLMLDGEGDPNTSPFYTESVSTLFSFSYALKFNIKKSTGIDYSVMPLEGLWWVEDMALFSTERKTDWLWTMMIHQPEWVTAEWVEQTRCELAKTKKPSRLTEVRFESFCEGLCVQMMHVGTFAEEAPNIAWIHTFAKEKGYRNIGKHHEIYLSDIHKTAPERLKTILRQPVG